VFSGRTVFFTTLSFVRFHPGFGGCSQLFDTASSDTASCVLVQMPAPTKPSCLPANPCAAQEMQKKLRDEYLGFGGSPNTPMGANYFLYIILGISFLAVLSWLSGAI